MYGELRILMLLFPILLQDSHTYDNGFEFVKGVWEESKYTSLEKITYEPGVNDIVSNWPSGPYSIPKPADGCPETRLKGWEEAYIDITWQHSHAVFSRTESPADHHQNLNTSRKYKDITRKELPYLQSFLIGPYSSYRMKLNFCSKTRKNESLDTGTWWKGNYNIYGDKSGCPKGFTSEIVTINLDGISHFSHDGYLPQFEIQRGNQTPDYLGIRLCSHVDEDNKETPKTLMSPAEPFILLHFKMLSSRYFSYNCPQISGTSVTEESLQTRLHVDNAELSSLLTFCYYRPYTWQQEYAPTELRDLDVSIFEGKYAVRSISTTGKLSQRIDFQRNNHADTYHDVAEILSNDFSPSVELHWKTLDVGRTVSLFGIFIPISDWPSTADTNAEYLRCFYSNKKLDFLHFSATVCTFKIGYSQTRFQKPVGHVLFMQRIYEGRYFTVMSDSHLMKDSFLSREVEVVVIITNNTLQILDEAKCNIDLGMTDYGIDNLQIFASSALPEFPAANARPFHSSWCADVKDNNPFIQVDLNIVLKIEGITIWNLEHVIETITNNSVYKRFIQIGVKAFSVYYGKSEETYTLYNNQIFRIVTMYPIDKPQTFEFMFPFRARFVKIHVLEALTEKLACLRFELHGCRKIDSKFLKCRSSSLMKRVQALNTSFTKPLREFENLTENECIGSCVKSLNCSIIKSAEDGYCSHYEANSNGTWKLATKRVDTYTWLTKLCSSEYIVYPFAAYAVINYNINWMNIKLLTFMSVIKESTIITSLGFPLNYGGGENYKWLIQFEETKFIKLVFEEVNFNIYQKNEDTIGCLDYVALNEEESRYDVDVTVRYKNDYLDRNTFVRQSGELRVDNTFNDKILAVETSLTHMTMTFVSCHPVDKMLNRGTGFRVIVLKEEIPACTSLTNFARFNEDRYEYCDKPSMTLSSMSYSNIPFAKRTEQWRVYRKKGFFRVDIIYFNVVCNSGTSFAINGKKYCNLDMAVFHLYTSSNTMTVTFRTERRYDMFHLKYTNVYDKMPATITQKAADIYAIHESIHYEARLTDDHEMNNLFLSGPFRSNVDIENIPRLIYKACAEKFNKCYSIFSYLGTWEFASGECWIRKERLVSIRSEKELQLIRYLIRNFKYTIDENSGIFQSAFRHNKTDLYYTYIGLRRRNKGNGIYAFHWENKSPSTFVAWAPGEPSYGDCTRMGFHLAKNDSTWETHNCLSESAFYFVCEDRFDNPSKVIEDRSVTHLYTGNVNTTFQGYTCQRWDSQYPHKHFYTDSMFPDKSISDASNFCRDPTESGVLWCLTVDPAVEWKVCTINELNEAVRPNQYTGYLDRTERGHKCQIWKGRDHNYCRNAFVNHKDEFYRYLWCFRDKDGKNVKTICSLKDTASDRCIDIRPSYKKNVNVSASGSSCQRWDMFYTPDEFVLLQFPDSNLENASNYCRDPTFKGFSWCFTTYPGNHWEICKIGRSDSLNSKHKEDIKSTTNEFKCKNGHLIESYKRCDGVINCMDLSDETECVEKNHPLIEDSLIMSEKVQKSNNDSQQLLYTMHVENNISRANSESIFQCTSQELVSFISLCDGVIDCIDASDEANCTQVNKVNGKCADDRFGCDDGNCIHVSLVCNFISDCVDSSDELCVYPMCSKEEYTCGNGQCIPMSLRCDANPDCLDKTDELNCESCSSIAFHCDYIRCLPKRILCDKFPDCTDGSDEQSCDMLKMKSCMDWWNAGYRESGVYILFDVVSGSQIKVYCGFDDIYSLNEICTTFQNIDIMERNGTLVIYTSYLEDGPFDQVIDFFFNTEGKANCSQEIVQSCNPVLQTISMTDDPGFEHTYSYCKCLIITLAISWEPEISSVKYCNRSEELDVDEMDDFLLFEYQYTNSHRALVWKNTPVKFEDIHLSVGDVKCIQEMFDVKDGDRSNHLKHGIGVKDDFSKIDLGDHSTSCPDGVNVLDPSEKCVYDIDRSGLITGCRSGTHLQNCGNTKCAKGNVQCPGSYCIPLKFLCDGVEHCPNAEDETGCGCEDSENEVLFVHEKGDARGPDFEMLVKQLHTPKGIIRSIEYSSYMLSEGIAFTHRMLNIKDKEMKPFEFIDRNYECEYKILANDFLASIPFTQTFKRSILFIQSSPVSELVADLMFGNITENPNIIIYRALESSNVTYENKFNFVIDVRVSNWKILSSLASRYLPEICKEGFSTTCPGYYKCSSSKLCLTLDQVCDGIRDCIYGDDELLCDFTCPDQCICAGFAVRCDILNATALKSYPKQTRLLNLEENRETQTLLSKEYLNFQFLYKLNVSSCKINEIQPNAFSKLINLRVLDLSNNLITTLFPSVFSGLQRLTTLILDGNSNLATLEAYTFQFLKSIKILRISSSKIKAIVANTFAGLNLKMLDIRDNYFEYIEEYGLGNLHVERISFQKNTITSFSKGMFTGVSSLKALHTPAYKYCCVRPNHVPENNCFPQKDEFSSCEDLMRISVLQTMLWLIGLCALLGNILSFIYRLRFDRERLKLGYGIFVTNLAGADFLMGVYLIMIAVADAVFRKRYIFMDDYWRNSVWCTLAGVLSTLSSEASVVFLCLITLDRLLVIKYPFGQVRFTTKKAVIFSIVAWIFCLFISIFPLLYATYFNDSFYNKSGVCIALPLTRDRPPGWLYSVFIFVVFNFVTFLLIALGQWSIFMDIRNSKRTLKMTHAGRKRDLIVARNLLLVVATDFLCWFPIGCIGLMAMSGRVISGDVYAWTAVFVLPVNSALNPVLYTLTAILGKKNFTPRMDEQAVKTLRTDIGKRFLINKAIIMRRFYVPEISPPSHMYKSLEDILQDSKTLPPRVALKLIYQIAQTLHVLHNSSLIMGKFEEKSIFIQIIDNKVADKIRILSKCISPAI